MKRSNSPYINRFISPDTIVPNPSNLQSWNRYSYVLNNPLKYTDPTGHMQASDDYQDSDNKCGKADKGCNNIKERIAKKKKVDLGIGEILTARNGQTVYRDANVISLSYTAGYGVWYEYLGVDLVWTKDAAVLFKTGGYDLSIMGPGIEKYPTESGNILSPQFGVSATYGTVASGTIRNDPSASGIINAYSETSKQEGFSLAFVTVNASSSASPNDGTPNFQTTTSSGGISLGAPDILAEYHLYTTGAIPIRMWP